MENISKAIFSLNCFKADDIKVRIYPIQHSLLGIQLQNHSYVAAEIKVLDNKTEDQLNALASEVQNLLENSFPGSTGKFGITTNITFLSRYYRRFKNF